MSAIFNSFCLAFTIVIPSSIDCLVASTSPNSIKVLVAFIFISTSRRNLYSSLCTHLFHLSGKSGVRSSCEASCTMRYSSFLFLVVLDIEAGVSFPSAALFLNNICRYSSVYFPRCGITCFLVSDCFPVLAILRRFAQEWEISWIIMEWLARNDPTEWSEMRLIVCPLLLNLARALARVCSAYVICSSHENETTCFTYYNNLSFNLGLHVYYQLHVCTPWFTPPYTVVHRAKNLYTLKLMCPPGLNRCTCTCMYTCTI